MPIKTRKTFCLVMSLSLFIGLIIAAKNSDSNFFGLNKADNANQITYSSSNQIVDGVAKTLSGTNIWSKADGVTWNNGSGKMSFAANGYLENNSALHGIESITVDMSGGSVDLFYQYKECADVENPMYFIKTITSSLTYTFTDISPTHFKVVAREASLINSIKVCYDCETNEEDANLESYADGLENSWIDAGSVGKYARTSYMVGEDNVSSGFSSRSLRLDFSNTENDFVLINTQKNNTRDDEPIPDLSNAVVTLKAKFSDNIENYGLRIKSIGSSWADTGYINMERSQGQENGWFSYSADLSNISFTGNNSIIRIAIQPLGINSLTKSTGYVLLDEIDYHYRNASSVLSNELIDEGLENMPLDDGQTNCDVTFDSESTFGRTSTSSIMLVPGREGKTKNSKTKWNVAFSPESVEGVFDIAYDNFTKGVLSFDYKPLNVSEPWAVYLRIYRSWGEDAFEKVTDSSTQVRDGWYHFRYDLSRLALSDGPCIRLYIGFDVDDAKLDQSKIYIDNIKLDNDATMREDYTLGWENMVRDSGWEKCNVTADYGNVATTTSRNSMRLTFTDKASDSNKNFICLSPQNQGISANYACNSGILEAKFKYSEGFADKTVRLVLVDSNWKCGRYPIAVTSIGNGWYQLKQDLSSLPAGMVDDSFNPSLNLIRLGFGFEYLNSSNKDDKTVWIDDVFLNNNYDVSAASSATIWQAYDTENILQTESTISGRNVTSSSPLLFKDIKGGINSTQLMIKANSTISSFSLRMPTVTTPNGDSIDAGCFEVLVEKYIYCPNNTSEKKGADYGWKGAGYYPDALVPIDRIIKADENNVNAGNQQGLWLNCNIPFDALPGDYTGTAILTIDGFDYNVPVQVKVYNARLSKTSHNKSMFLIWNDQTQIGENMSSNASIRNEYYKFLLKKNINGDNNRDYEWKHDPLDKYESFANDFAKYVMPNRRITTYRIPSDTTYEDIYGYMNALVDKNIEEWNNGNHVNFFDKAMFALLDEPVQPSDTNLPDIWVMCRNMQTYIAQAKSALASKVADYPVIRDGLNDIRNILTMNCDYDNITGGVYKEHWIKDDELYPNVFSSEYIDTPCPTFDHLDDATQRNAYLNTFDHVWFYGCVLPNLPYPSFHTDSQLLGQRTITWMQYQYGIEGQLYFCINFYQNQDTIPFSDRDVWTDPLSGGMAAGDGQLVYPGERYNIYGPISTLRMEIIRASYEDYEYFYMLDQNMAKYNANTSNAYSKAIDFISIETAKMYSGTKLLTRPSSFASGYKPSSFEAYRTYILEQLEYLN